MDIEQSLELVAALLDEGVRSDGIVSYSRIDGEPVFGVETVAGEFFLKIEPA